MGYLTNNKVKRRKLKNIPFIFIMILFASCNIQGDQSSLEADFRPGLVREAQTPPAAPASLSYSTPTAIYVYNHVSGLLTDNITPNAPTVTSKVDTYSISPDLTANTGLNFNTSTGVISGKPSQNSNATTYTITATNITGSTTATVSIRANAGFVVNSLDDAGNDASTVNDCDADPGPAKDCTLRAAIEQINTWNLNSNFVVLLPAGTITPASTMTINTRIEIIGVSQTTTIIDGDNQPVQLFHAEAPSFWQVKITDLTLTNAANRAITNAVSYLALERVTLSHFTSGTTGGALSISGGVITIKESRFQNNSGTQGGAIYISNGGLNIETTHFLSNHASVIANCSGSYVGGGAIDVFYATSLNINKSLFELNSTNGCGGALRFRTIGSYYFRDTTFTGNTANRGAVFFLSSSIVNVSNCTITGNTDAHLSGAAVYNRNGSMRLANTIVTDNWVNLGATAKNCFGTIINQGNNLSDLADCNFGVGGNNIDANLDLLEDNGGHTRTFSLPLGSPAIDAGNNAYCLADATDQRGIGFNRRVNGTCDIGAYESQ